ncbi:hypothetical protein A2U01_0051310, partial [Trifolium medium]|nr:hypothetical protein [Trifolium medium]
MYGHAIFEEKPSLRITMTPSGNAKSVRRDFEGTDASSAAATCVGYER